MSKARRNGAFGLALAAVAGLMALGAVGAWASEKAWLENGADIAANKLLEVGGHTEASIDVEAQNLVIHCATVAGNDVLLIAGTTEVLGELQYSSCKILQNGMLSTACDKHLNGAKVEGLLEPIVMKFKAHLILVGGVTKILGEPREGLNFGQVKYDPSCALPETSNLRGSYVVECLTPELKPSDCLTERVTQLLGQGGEAGDTLTYGTNPAKALGIAKAKLASNNPWCGHV
jgi:hypothetical protein